MALATRAHTGVQLNMYYANKEAKWSALWVTNEERSLAREIRGGKLEALISCSMEMCHGFLYLRCSVETYRNWTLCFMDHKCGEAGVSNMRFIH
jgi:hypothetical protein